jgi:hypothetical protein
MEAIAMKASAGSCTWGQNALILVCPILFIAALWNFLVTTNLQKPA